MTPISRRTICSTTERCSASGSLADRLRVLEAARVEHGLRGEDAELLGEERRPPTGSTAYSQNSPSSGRAPDDVGDARDDREQRPRAACPARMSSHTHGRGSTRHQRHAADDAPARPFRTATRRAVIVARVSMSKRRSATK